MSEKTILITGAAKRIGAVCARLLHAEGCRIIVHYRSAGAAAEMLCAELNRQRPDSAVALQADLCCLEAVQNLARDASAHWHGIDALINNASAFYPTPLPDVSASQWEELINGNLRAPFFLTQALSAKLAARRGCVVNIVDIHAERGLPDYPVYCIAKAGLAAMTKILAKELAPAIRVNGVAPGAILWPEREHTSAEQRAILERIPLARCGDPEDIAQAARFLIEDAPYITGQIIAVDGGRTLFS